MLGEGEGKGALFYVSVVEQGRGGAPCAPIMPIVDTVLSPNTGQQGPLREPPSRAQFGQFWTKFAHTPSEGPGGGGQPAAVRKNISVTRVPAFWRLLDNGLVTRGGSAGAGAATWTFKFEMSG